MPDSFEYKEYSIPRSFIRVTLLPTFEWSLWEDLEQFYYSRIEQGIIHWELDLRQIHHINSMLIGLMVGFNTILTSRKGSLRLLVSKGSPTFQVLFLSKIPRIIPVQEF